MTQLCHTAYQSTRLDETNTMVPVSSLYLQFVTSYCQKRLVNPYDLGWPQMTFQRDLERATVPRTSMVAYKMMIMKKWEWFYASTRNRKQLLSFPIDLSWERSRQVFALRSQIQNIWDIRFVDNHILIIFHKFHIDPWAAGVSGRTRRARGVNITPPGYLRNEAP